MIGFTFHQSSRTSAPGGQVVLKAEPPDGRKYVYEWCPEAGTLEPWVPACDDEQAPACDDEQASTAKRGKSWSAGGHWHALGPKVVWQAPECEGPFSVELRLAPAEELDAKTRHRFTVEVLRTPVAETLLHALENVERGLSSLSGPRTVQLDRSDVRPTTDQALWVAIRDGARRISFPRYASFIEQVLCRERAPDDCSQNLVQDLVDGVQRVPRGMLYHGVDAYQVLKTATQVFLILHCGLALDPKHDAGEEEGRGIADVDQLSARLCNYLGDGPLPYLRRILEASFGLIDPMRGDDDFVDSPFCKGLLCGRVYDPCLLELIWSYWHEEGMQIQTLNTVSLRFQNKRGSMRNPLSQLELDPLRPLSHLLWGYVQDEPHRLTVARRAYEYSHHYGLTLLGRAVPKLKPADPRSKFLEAFHALLHRTSSFYQDDADVTIKADGFEVLNALREVHLLLAEGANNQYGDLPWTARVEMLIEQWLLARPEMRTFLGTRAMVPYREAWMGQVDTMKRLQQWDETSVTHYHDLAATGEQILLSIRFGDWSGVENEEQARNWARYWRQEIQRYIHAYRAVTGVDLAASRELKPRVDATQPSVLLQRRLTERRKTG